MAARRRPPRRAEMDRAAKLGGAPARTGRPPVEKHRAAVGRTGVGSAVHAPRSRSAFHFRERPTGSIALWCSRCHAGSATTFPQLNLPAISPDGTRLVFFGQGEGGRFFRSGAVHSSLSRFSPSREPSFSGGPPLSILVAGRTLDRFLLGRKTQDDRGKRRRISERWRMLLTQRVVVGAPTERSSSAPQTGAFVPRLGFRRTGDSPARARRIAT